MLDQCVALCSLFDSPGHPHLLTMYFAKIIHKRFADPEGQSLPKVDLNLFIEKIHEHIKECQSQGTLDQHIDGKCSEPWGGGTPQIKLVKYTVLDDVTGEDHTFYVSHLIDCITEATKIKSVAELNKMEWQLGAGGKQQCHVAMACEDTECPFITASRHVHRVKKPTAMSRYFLAVIMDKIREWKDEAAIMKEMKAEEQLIRETMGHTVMLVRSLTMIALHQKMESPSDCPHRSCQPSMNRQP
jgi:hypothetical protein